MAKASSNVISLEFYNKKTNKLEKTFDQIKRIAKFIGRANDPTKCIGNKNSKFLLANIADQINRSKTGIIFIDHDWISEITDCLTDQNLNLLKQLSDIFYFEYHRFLIFEGEKKCYGYTVRYTEDGIERINNPELFYPQFFDQNLQNDCKKSSAIRPKKYDYVTEKIRLHDRKNSAIHAQVQYRDLDILDINKDLSDLCSSEGSSLCIEGQDLKDLGNSFNSSHQVEQESNTEFSNMTRMDRMIAKEQARRERDALEGNSFEERLAREIAKRDEERLALARQQEPTAIKQTEPNANNELLEVARLELVQAKEQQSDTHTRNGNLYYNNKLLSEFKITAKQIETIRQGSNKPHYTCDRIWDIVKKITARKSKLRIWGGENAFINYMVKAVNNEKEKGGEDQGQSIAEMKRAEMEQRMLNFKNGVVTYF